jgi:type IV secretion system protein VirB3
MHVGQRNGGLTREHLFVGATRPPMRWGVTYSALLFNMVFTMEAFLVTKNLLSLLLCVPIHALCLILCARDARFFDLIMLWGQTRLPALMASTPLLHATTYSPLAFSTTTSLGRRRLSLVAAQIWSTDRGRG